MMEENSAAEKLQQYERRDSAARRVLRDVLMFAAGLTSMLTFGAGVSGSLVGCAIAGVLMVGMIVLARRLR